MKNEHLGSNFDDFLEEEGLRENPRGTLLVIFLLTLVAMPRGTLLVIFLLTLVAMMVHFAHATPSPT